MHQRADDLKLQPCLHTLGLLPFCGHNANDNSILDELAQAMTIGYLGIKSVYSNGVEEHKWRQCRDRARSMGLQLVEEKATVSAHLINKDLNTSAVLAFFRQGWVTL